MEGVKNENISFKKKRKNCNSRFWTDIWNITGNVVNFNIDTVSLNISLFLSVVTF